MYPQGVCRIRKPASAGNGCAIFPAFDAEERAEKIRSPAADDLFRGSLDHKMPLRRRNGIFFYLPENSTQSRSLYGYTRSQPLSVLR